MSENINCAACYVRRCFAHGNMAYFNDNEIELIRKVLKLSEYDCLLSRKQQMRFEAACAAMTGWIAHFGMSNISGDVNIKKHNKIAINCRKLADALVAELEKGKDEED